MFLNALQKENKELFLALCVHAARANGTFEIDEEEMIYAYCREMSLIEHIPEDIDEVDSLIKSMEEKTSNIEKKIVVMELLGFFDLDVVSDEKKFMIKVIDGLKVEPKVVDSLTCLLKEYISAYKKLYTLISE